ncbi:MAG: hypothetical protein QG556_837 [Pseudomonadota bacterium]|nr:hypothetical protein [Pseudomonadota bacterium]
MKIEIDLNEILGDESGVETLADSVRRQVTNKLAREIKENIGNQIDRELSQAINGTIKEQLLKFMPDTIAELMNTEYVCVDRYGDRQKTPTTFRKELVKAIHEQMVYKKTNYQSDMNYFSKAVDSTIEENVKDFKNNFNTLVSKEFTQQCFDYAKTELAKKLGVK